ncbi:PorP/SprF family type IX secretion system membrane protein [Pedobacter hiemivivus]|uniref:Type IX secretion system membrane protein PorP/SprF n=1 Tax=Pedobacter hiemivivus TaxID=2530454 RepID=A0A4R0MHN7_9SPHI|nr:PorP/SprF family type IX secretion system membrane protein [Pedobacter hiemivivus]TCC85853.1 type IX secretion system membrane protein PorP/SprF [Pedobacter hiemivivus]
MKLYKQLLGVIAVCALFVNLGYAQLNPLSAQYYTNQYLANPAFAGAEQGLKLNGVYRKLWNNVPGSPLTQNLTTDYGFNKVGIGLTLNNESAGLQRQTRIVGTYAYHLKLNESNDQLHFGVSIGLMSQRLENADIYGNASDPMVGQYNDRKPYLDGDLGIAYTSGKLSLQAAVPNLKSVLKKDAIKLADVATFYAAASYKIKISEGAEAMNLEPLVAYRGVKGFDNIWDAGAQLDIANKQVFLLGMYHSTENATFGLGMNFKKKYLVSGIYTTQTSALSNYTNGSFELNLRLKI